MSIQLLPEQLASQIAAGEVVERPSSVVKELVENAIDAGATTINVDVQNGGRQLIQVADNGSGISADDIEKAFLRHATSKLETADDLKAILTLGFRGEALSAIAAVSQVTVVSRVTGEEAGTRLSLDGGVKISRETVGAPQGTVIAVENLFYNVPARLKFLKSITTEKRLIDEFVTRYALAYPRIRFRLTHNGRVTFQSNGNGNLLDVLVAVYSPETARQLLQVIEEEEESGAQREERRPVGVSGYVGPPSLHWSNRSHITLFVNGRWIRDNSLTYAIIQAYHTLLPSGRYPLAILFVTMAARDVDVNVHPAKTEVRFRHPKVAFGAVQRAVRQTLVADAPIGNMSAWSLGSQIESVSVNWSGSPGRDAFTRREETAAQSEWEWPTSTAGGDDAVVAQPATLPVADLEEAEQMPIMRVVGQVGASYIITEGPDGMFLISQQAAHERILYEQIVAQWQAGEVTSQELEAGTALHLSPSQTTLLEGALSALATLGFQVDPFGPNAFMVRAVPAILERQDPAQALLDLVADLEGNSPPQDELEARIVKRICKTAAVKTGHSLTMPQMQKIVQQLEACQAPQTCPEGRPTFIHLSVAQLARQFGRS